MLLVLVQCFDCNKTMEPVAVTAIMNETATVIAAAAIKKKSTIEAAVEAVEKSITEARSNDRN